jgi:hypothetical protein
VCGLCQCRICPCGLCQCGRQAKEVLQKADLDKPCYVMATVDAMSAPDFHMAFAFTFLVVQLKGIFKQ